MFVCDCPSCGRRELRGPRSLHPVPTDAGTTWTSICRGCGKSVLVAETRPRATARKPRPAEQSPRAA